MIQKRINFGLARNILEKKYLNEKKSTSQIAKEHKCHSNTVINRLEEFNIERRTPGEGASLVLSGYPKDEIINFAKTHVLKEIQNRFRFPNYKATFNYCFRHNIPHKKEKDPKEGLLPKEIISWLCSSISTDGCASLDKNSYLNLIALTTIEKDWILQGSEILEKYGIDYSIQGPYKGKYSLRISDKEVLRIYLSILKYKYSKFIMKRKLFKIKEYLTTRGLI